MVNDLEGRVKTVETRVDRHERLLLGHAQDDSDQWIDGLVQKAADMSRYTRLLARYGLPIIALSAVLELLLVLHAFGGKAIWDFVKALHP